MNDANSEQKALALRLEAQSLIISDDRAYQFATEVRERAVTFIAERVDYWREPKEKAKAAHSEICAKERADIGPAQEVKLIIGQKMAEYQQRQDEAKRALEAEAMAAAIRSAESAVISEAATLEASGQQEAAEAVLDAPLQVGVVAVGVPSTPKIAGTHYRGNITLSITDSDALIAALLANPATRSYVVVDESGLRGYVKSRGGRVDLPGLNVLIGLTPVTKRRKSV